MKEHNKKNDPSMHIKQRGASSIDLPPALMVTFFKPLFEKIKDKVAELI